MEHTVSVIPEEQKLIVPLREDAERVFEESDNDQEAANCRNVSKRQSVRIFQSPLLPVIPIDSPERYNIRFDRV